MPSGNLAHTSANSVNRHQISSSSVEVDLDRLIRMKEAGELDGPLQRGTDVDPARVKQNTLSDLDNVSASRSWVPKED